MDSRWSCWVRSPLGKELNTAAVRRQVWAVAECVERELSEERPHFIEGYQRDWVQPRRPDPPLTVGLDDGYARARYPKSPTGAFELIASKVLRDEGDPTCVAVAVAGGYAY